MRLVDRLRALADELFDDPDVVAAAAEIERLEAEAGDIARWIVEQWGYPIEVGTEKPPPEPWRRRIEDVWIERHGDPNNPQYSEDIRIAVGVVAELLRRWDYVQCERRGGSWEIKLHGCNSGEWHEIDGDTPGDCLTVAGPTIHAALEAAVAMRPPLPRYPHPPRWRDWEVVRDGSVWRLNCTDGSTSKWPTRKAATAQKYRQKALLRADIEAWNRDVGPLTWQGHGTEWLWDDDPIEAG